MQIMPTVDSGIFSSSAINNVNNYGGSQSVFEDELESQNSTSAEESSSTRVALNEAPYSLVSTSTTTYTIDEVCFTKKELQDLEKNLKEAGAPDSTLEGLRALAGLPDGANLGQVLASLQQQREYASLSDSDITAIQSFAGRIDPSGKLADTLIGCSNAQNGEGLLNSLVTAVGNVNGRVDISKDEMAALAKAAGLSSTASAQLQGSFGSYSSLQLNKTELQTFLAPAMSDFAGESSDADALKSAMDSVLGPMMSAAKARMEAEAEASALEGRKSQQSKIRIQDNVLQNVNRNIENARAAQMSSDAAQSAQANVQGQGKNSGQMVKDALSGENSEQLAAEKLALQKQNGMSGQGGNGKDAFANGNGKENFLADEQNSGWGNLLGNTEIRAGMENMFGMHSNNITTPILGVNMPQETENIAPMPTATQASTRQMSAQMAAQLEQSILTAAADGSKSLELQLHPAELGSLTIMLTLRNGEMNAMIRSEKTETAELLNQQLDQLRLSLEQQGVKLDKLEVQNQGAENDTQDLWDGMKEHNARQEENTRRETLERLRALSSVRNHGTSIESATLEQYMHDESYVARNATQSLYIVA